MRLVDIVHEHAGTATVPESTARVLARKGWRPVEQIEVTDLGDIEPSTVPTSPPVDAGDDPDPGE